MILVVGTSVLVALALTVDIVVPRLAHAWRRHRARVERTPTLLGDPGRELRAEQTARELLRSCVRPEEWDMYRELGFIRVWGAESSVRSRAAQCAYLIYPHLPIVAFAPQTGRLLGEYCVEFPDQARPYGSDRLPDSDDVLAKWMALTGDERSLLEAANLHLAGRQVAVAQVTKDLWRLSRWERQRLREAAGGTGIQSHLSRG